MKKIATLIILISGCLSMSAQTLMEAMNYSQEGTARTMAMGNAFTALGGDLGSVSINPAGSAVAKYSQIGLSTGLTISTNVTQGYSPYADGSLPYFERQMKNSRTRMNIPNIGFILNYDTNRSSGIKNVSFGFIVNSSHSWQDDLYASGTNSTTSFIGQMAEEASYYGYSSSDLGSSSAFATMPWKSVIGYQSNMISNFGGYDDLYVGATEQIYEEGVDQNGLPIYNLQLGGPLDQSYGRRTLSKRNDMILNLGANISDFLYLGVNLGLVSVSHTTNDYFKEAAVNPDDFTFSMDTGETVSFNSMIYRYSLSQRSDGAYGQLGFILTPGGGLRIGGAIQTPTFTSITEQWMESGETVFSSKAFSKYVESPIGEDSYRVRNPWKANVGLAYAIGRFGVISADYEVCDLSSIKYSTDLYENMDYISDLNQHYQSVLKTRHNFRAGIEVRPYEMMAIRAGYEFETDPYKTLDEFGEDTIRLSKQNISFGLGFNSEGSFFADIACRKMILMDEYIMPYPDYIFDDEGYVSTPVPEILNKTSMWKVILTLGWRF